MIKTRISTFDHSWNPTRGCSRGCSYCYARRMAHRFKQSFEPTCHPERLAQPASVRKPSRIFVDSAGDLFDPGIPLRFVVDVVLAMRAADWHTYFVLTKRPERMLEFARYSQGWHTSLNYGHLWLGVSVTNQADADERIPLLLQTPAAHRFISFEPLLSEVDAGTWFWSMMSDAGKCAISWAIIGGDSSPGAKPPAVEWVKSLTRQCVAAGVRVYHKNNLRRVISDLRQEFQRAEATIIHDTVEREEILERRR